MADKFSFSYRTEDGEPGSSELIFVYVPESIGPIDRGDKYEDPLDDELRLRSLGSVSGAGTELGEPREDGTRDILSCGIDVDATDVGAARALLREQLPILGCPAGTLLQYDEGDQALQDEYDGSDWRLAQPRPAGEDR